MLAHKHNGCASGVHNRLSAQTAPPRAARDSPPAMAIPAVQRTILGHLRDMRFVSSSDTLRFNGKVCKVFRGLAWKEKSPGLRAFLA